MDFPGLEIAKPPHAGVAGGVRWVEAAAIALRGIAFTALIAAAAAGCTARTTSPDAPEGPAAVPPAPTAVAPAPSLPTALGALAGDDTARDAAATDRSCGTDSDCAVKDVGSCCGYFPMCVNKDAPTDPAGVRARCESDGLSSVCGFREVRGCACVEGRCENLADGASDR